MKAKTLHIGLAALQHPKTVVHGIEKVVATLRECNQKKVDIVCFPETYIPGLRGGSDDDLPPPNREMQVGVLRQVQTAARDCGVAVIIGMEWPADAGLYNRAYVISPLGKVLGYQTKNQISSGGEMRYYIPDGRRKIFLVNGVKFGIVICHEGWRYPETVRWAAVRGAQIVFQPQYTRQAKGLPPKTWGESFYEKAMICRSSENSIYFASVNHAHRLQNSATSLIDPSGNCIAYVPYGNEELLIRDIDLAAATRFYAKRYNPALNSGRIRSAVPF